jgi:hypothetical protein
MATLQGAVDRARGCRITTAAPKGAVDRACGCRITTAAPKGAVNCAWIARMPLSHHLPLGVTLHLLSS